VDHHPTSAPVAAGPFTGVPSLARYQGRTLDAYRYDLRAFFQWAADDRLDILKATRPQIELYVRAMEARGLAATTIDRRLSTVCGFYRFAHIDGRIASNPAQYVRRPKVHPNDARGLDRAELGPSDSRPSGSTTPTPPWLCSLASTACA
jgi:integrase/recombinase XerD